MAEASRAGVVSHSPRIFWVDFARSVSVFMVILIHASAPVVNKWNEIFLIDWMFGNIYDSLARVSVPILFMISGFLLLGKQESISSFFSRRAVKVLIPFLFWSLFYLLWIERYPGYSPFLALKAIIKTILLGPTFYHLWFLYALMPLYLLVPILRRFILPGPSPVIWYFVLVWLMVGPVLHVVEDLLGFEIAFDLTFMDSYVGYFVLGYLLGRIEYTARLIWGSVVILTACVSFTIIATHLATSNLGKLDEAFYQYRSLNVALGSSAAFLMLRSMGDRIAGRGSHVLVKIFSQLGMTSFGIYLVHVFVLQLLRHGKLGFELSALIGPAGYTVLLTAIVTFIISYAITAILQTIPILRAVAPA